MYKSNIIIQVLKTKKREVFKMENITSKLQVGDTFVINTDEYFGLKGGRYKIVGFGKNRLGGALYKVQHDRKNAVTSYNLHVCDVDRDLYVPKIEDLTNRLGIAFLNFRSLVKYDKELIAQAKKINSER